MSATRVWMASLLAMGWVAVGCAGADNVDVLTYDEFKAQAYLDPETGVFLVDGDEPVNGEARLREVYESYLDSVTRAGDPGYGTTEQGLIINRVGDQDDKWLGDTALHLNYCVSLVGFGLNYARVVTAMRDAAAAWEDHTWTKFHHLVAEDALCSVLNSNSVVFEVRPGSFNDDTYAVAFFPSYEPRLRNIRIANRAFGNISPITLTGLLRHELGHVLGFRHEHIRPEQPYRSCHEGSNWRALTPYDSASVMHYPHCNGSNRGDLVLTERDRAGVAMVYPLPGGG